ncbi:MAG: hypothetical protein WCS70_02800 [Verrucomicrobiota bacterium]
MAVALGVWPGLVCGELALTAPGDPNRSWSVSELTTVGYDDNVNTTPNSSSNRVGSATINVTPQVSLKLPGEQTSGQLRYTYRATYYTDRKSTTPDQSHVVDAALSHAFTPRLTTTLGETFVRGLSPELVDQQISGTPIITRQRGDYSYNAVNGGATFQLTSRWSVSLNQSWDRWMFDEKSQAESNDRDDYSTLASASYSLDPRTFVGGSYRLSLTDYSIANSTNTQRDSISQSLYATVVRRFNPLLVAQANVGLQLAGYNNTTDLSPYVSLSSSYNFGANSTLSGGFTYNIQLTEVAQYLSSDQASTFISLQYRMTPKLRFSVDLAYVISSYRNLNPVYDNPNDVTQQSSATENSWRIGTSINYDFTKWAALYLNYSYDGVNSGLDNPITGLERSYDRNQCGIGLRLSY